jgi:hypothetical protein
MSELGLGRLRSLEPKIQVQRDQWEKTGDLIQVDNKLLARIERVGHRITGNRHQGSTRGAGYEKVYMAIDDATRQAYVEVLPDEQKATKVGLLIRDVGCLSQQGITRSRVLSNNGSSLWLWRVAKGMRRLGLQAHPHQAINTQNERQG